MTTENAKEVSPVENMTKHEMIKIIKDAKKESEPQVQENSTSIYNIMKDSMSEMIEKIESTFPKRLEMYSALYLKYLHAINDLYGAYYMSKKEFFGNIEPDKAATHAFGACWKFATNMATAHVDTATSFLQAYVQMRLEAVESYNKIARLTMDAYTQTWNQFKIKQ